MVEIRVKPSDFLPHWFGTEEGRRLSPDTWRFRTSAGNYVWRPPTDVYETEDTLVVRVEIAGMRESDFSIEIEERSLVIRGVRSDINERRAYHQMEIPFGDFGVEIELTVQVMVDNVEAFYRDGFLRVMLPKAQPHRIKISE